MTTVLAVAAAVSLLGILHGYFGYPLLTMALARTRGGRRAAPRPAFEPFASLLVCAYNEERSMADKIRNSLALDWPPEKFELVVVSDGSSDRTCEIVRSFDDPRVRLLALEKNAGKTSALHAGMAVCRGEIVVMSDANSMYDRDAIRHLVAALADDGVGAACGELKYEAPGRSASGETEGLYWRYETAIKRAESRASTLIGANGSIYAIRRAEFVPIAPDLMDDLLIPLMVAVERRKPTVYVPAAIAREEPGDDFAKEYRRKIRIVSSALLSLVRTAPRWLRRPGIAYQLFSHKILRWFAPYLAIVLLASTVALASFANPLRAAAVAALACQAAFHAAWAFAAAFPKTAEKSRAARVLYYFYVVNSAAFFGVLHFLTGKKYVTWNTIRS